MISPVKLGGMKAGEARGILKSTDDASENET